MILDLGWKKLSRVLNCRSELVSESAIYYTILTHKSQNILTELKTQLRYFKNSCVCVVVESQL